jgi:hypothetical protein
LLGVAWSVPNYHVPMPSWYNLFLATFGLAALLRHVDHPRARWLIAAGLCGGLSFLVKSIGLYYVAGAALFLVLRAHHMACEAGGNARRSVAYPAFVSVMTAGFVAALVVLVHTQAGPSEIFHHVLPGAIIGPATPRASRPSFALRARSRRGSPSRSPSSSRLTR